MPDYDMRQTAMPTKNVVIKEHPVESGAPVSYMAFANLSNSIHEIMEILDLMNMEDDLPQWADQLLSEAADRIKKVKGYILAQKDVDPAHINHEPDHECGHIEQGLNYDMNHFDSTIS